MKPISELDNSLRLSGMGRITEVPLEFEDEFLAKKITIGEIKALHRVNSIDFNNAVVKLVKEDFFKRLHGDPINFPVIPQLRLNYVALGTSSVATTQGMTTLVAEVYRGIIRDSLNTNGGSGENKYDSALNKLSIQGFYVPSTQGNDPSSPSSTTWFINEIGAFCGTATSSANTGTMYARTVLTAPFQKNNTKGFLIENWEWSWL
jgi:hypothetical protein